MNFQVFFIAEVACRVESRFLGLYSEKFLQ